MNEFTLALLKSDTLCVESPVRYFDSFIAIETYICMTPMMMLDITMEVSINKSLPIKGRPKPRLGTLWYFRHFGIIFQKLYSYGLRAKFT